MWQFADRLIDGFFDDGACEMVGVLRGAVHAHGHRRPGGRTRVRPLTLPRAARRPRTRTSATSRSSSSTNGSTGTSRIAAGAPRTTCSPGWPPRPSPTARTPEVKDAALIAANLFAGGQETTVRLLSFALRMLGERPDLQEPVREDRERIPNFIEETLRLESPLRTQFRMARVATELGGVDIPAGGVAHAHPGCVQPGPAGVREPVRVRHRPAERPPAHRLRARDPHVCGRAARPSRGAGDRQPLPRPHRDHHASPRSTTDRPDARRYDYLPTFFLRGLENLNLEFTPAG